MQEQRSIEEMRRLQREISIISQTERELREENANLQNTISYFRLLCILFYFIAFHF